MLSLAENESAMWAFIRAHGGNDAADKFAVVQREMNSLRQELQEAKLDAQKRRNELDRLSETRDVQLKSALDSRDKALDDIAILRKQLDATRQENDNRAAEAAHQLTKLTELYERLCASEKESTTINHVRTLLNFKKEHD
jgi:predicted  nucleic acid-binding Zn-ribbon protein